MNELHRALGDIRNIRRQVAQATEFRGYGPLMLMATGLFAVVAGVVQTRWVPLPVEHPLQYVAVWAGAAALSLLLIAVSTLTRARRMHSGMENEMIRMAAEQFAPAFVAGALLTLVVLRAAHYNSSTVWMLSGLWQIIYSLGIFASCRFMPKGTAAAGAWYLGMGLLCLSTTDARALSPWHMAFPFAFGQCLIAMIVHVFGEGADDEQA